MTKYNGSCHCGAIKFEIEAELTNFRTCNCSICKKKNAVMMSVNETDFKLLQGQEHLALYQWNLKIAKHHFCKICGIYTFHHTRSIPGVMGVNVNCLDDVDLSHIPIKYVDGASLSSKTDAD
ncbi:MAG: GFA family protein [OCS116 cluster bacterium]|nr:GFA family protein [OCS116 cluster bacterium]